MIRPGNAFEALDANSEAACCTWRGRGAPKLRTDAACPLRIAHRARHNTRDNEPRWHIKTTPSTSIDPPDLNTLFSDVYSQLRRLARGQRGAGQDTLNTTALVHELFLQMSRGGENLKFIEPRQFYAYAAQAMRHLLIDRARARARIKRGGDLQRVDLTESAADPARMAPEQALALDAALRKLAVADARAAEVVELHYFAGLPVERIATLLGTSSRTIDRDWRYARAFLHSQLDD